MGSINSPRTETEFMNVDYNASEFEETKSMITYMKTPLNDLSYSQINDEFN